MLSNGVTVANGKGGAGKTTLVANLAALAAVNQWKVLAVDLDYQGNLSRDLGYADEVGNDRGKALHLAVTLAEHERESMPEGTRPLADVRPGLDVYPAGEPWTVRVAESLDSRRRRDPRDVYGLEDALNAAAASYDLILFDCPPDTHSPMTEAALAVSAGLVIPTFRDEGSVDGLERMAEAYRRTVGTAESPGANPQLRLLGCALINFAPREIRTRQVRERLDANLKGAPVFEALVSEQTSCAEHCRTLGLTAHEYDKWAKGDTRSLRDYIRRGMRRPSQAHARYASEWAAICQEVLAAYTERQEELAAVAGGADGAA